MSDERELDANDLPESLRANPKGALRLLKMLRDDPQRFERLLEELADRIERDPIVTDPL